MEILPNVRNAERKAINRLTKYGLKMKYHREGDNGWYIIYANEDRPHIEWPEDVHCEDIWEVLKMTERLHERYST